MVTSSYPLRPGDVTAPFIEQIARGVAARGHDVSVVLPHHPELRRAADEPVRLLPYRYAPFDSWCLWGYAQSLESDVRVRRGIYLLLPAVAFALRHRVAAELQDRRYDVVHAHWVVPNAALIADVLRAHRVPLVVSLHGSDVYLAERLCPARALARSTFAMSGAVTACSGDLHRRALRLGADAARTLTVPYGVDGDAFAPSPQHDSALRRRLGVPEGALFVLGVGRLVEKKGFRHVIDAAATLSDVFVGIAGEGDLRRELEGQIAATGAPVRLLGSLEREPLAAALAAADVVVVPSVVDAGGNVDGLPNTLLEAMAAGRPIVASRVAGIPDVVEDEEEALLVAPGDPAAIARGLLRLRDEPELRARLGAAARRKASEQLSWSHVARTFEECYARAAALAAR